MKVILTALILTSCLFYSCDKCRYVDPAMVSTYIEITYKDKISKNFLITKDSPDFKPQDYTVTSEDGEEVEYNFHSTKSLTSPYADYYVLSIRAIKGNFDPDIRNCRTIFIDHKNDRDTINFCYQIEKTRCGGMIYNHFEMRYNGLDIDTKNGNNLSIDIEK